MFLYIYKVISISLISFLLIGCNLPKPDWSKPAEPDGKKRARQNVEKGKGITFLNSNKGGTNIEFASSNPLWRASLDTLDFLVLSNVDYAGGLIISDWYSEKNPDEAVKITVRFLTSEVRSDALDITVHKKNCKNQNCIIKKIKSDLTSDIRDKILKRAAYYVKLDEDKSNKDNEGKFKISEQTDRY